MMNGLLFILPLYIYGDPAVVVKTAEHVHLLLVAAISTILPLFAIFFFGNRSRQKGLTWMGIFSSLVFFGLTVLEVENQKKKLPPGTNMQYAIPGILVTVVAIIFMILAVRAIRKDEKLIRSLDRLR
jgi:hypothetical protein